jgi:hypothetical protein
MNKMQNKFWSRPMRKLCFAGVLFLGGITQAGAVTIDFDNDLPTVFGLETWQEDGFTLTSNVPDGTLVDNNNLVRGALGVSGTGNNTQSIFWGENGSTSTLTLVHDTQPGFDLISLDASSMSNSSGVLILEGTLIGGGTVTQNINLDGNLTTYNISGMDGLASLDISFDGASFFAPFDLDNIVAAVVPVPAAVWLFGSAIGLLGFRLRKVRA